VLLKVIGNRHGSPGQSPSPSKLVPSSYAPLKGKRIGPAYLDYPLHMQGATSEACRDACADAGGFAANWNPKSCACQAFPLNGATLCTDAATGGTAWVPQTSVPLVGDCGGTC
jgi:hypothetical protein